MRRATRALPLWALVPLFAACASESENPPHESRDAGQDIHLTDSTMKALAALSPDALPAPPPDVSNAHGDDPRAAALGQRLFFDPGFSGRLLDPDHGLTASSLGAVGQSGRVSCASCHVPKAGFIDDRSERGQVSLGAAWGHRKTPSLLDVGQARLLMWDGRHDALFNQPFGALENGVEMNSSRLYAAQRIYARYRPAYEAVFGPITTDLEDGGRFPKLDAETTGCGRLAVDIHGISSALECRGVPGDGAEWDGMAPEDQRAVTRIWANAGKAIAAYERLLSCGSSRFDQWVHGAPDALSLSEQRGAALFVGQRQDGSALSTPCSRCHRGAFMTDQQFHNVGMRPIGVGPAATFVDADDEGAFDGLREALQDPLNVRGEFSDGNDGRLPDRVPVGARGAFRTPSLRCVSQRLAFMHNGQYRSLSAVIDHFDRGGDENGYPGTSEVAPLRLSEEERADLLAFLESLDGPGPEAALLADPGSR